MRTTSMVAVAAAMGLLLAGCGPTTTPTGNGPTPTGGQPTAASTPSPTPTVKNLTAGNCTLYPKASAVALVGAINLNNNALNIGTDGGTKIDVCSYLDLLGTSTVQGVTYAVVRYDSAATAYAEAEKVQTEMLANAAEQAWPVQSLTAPVPGAGPLLGGSGTKTEDGLAFTIAVVGTNVGPYLVTALGGSTVSEANAKSFALAVFQALAAAVG